MVHIQGGQVSRSVRHLDRGLVDGIQIFFRHDNVRVYKLLILLSDGRTRIHTFKQQSPGIIKFWAPFAFVRVFGCKEAIESDTLIFMCLPSRSCDDKY
jgi:hypothetical protein